MKHKYNTLQNVWTVLNQYWQDLGSPLSLRLSQLLATQNFDLMVRILDNINTQNLARKPLRLRRTRWAIDIIKKADYLPLGIDTHGAAVEKWCAAERQCRQTNWRFKYIIEGIIPFCDDDETTLSYLARQWVPKVRKEVQKIMGEIPDLDEVFGGFGPGATLSNQRRESSVLYKLAATPTLTRDAEWFYPALPERLRAVWGEREKWGVVMAGRLSFVPKSYKTDRPIMVEPLVNASIQRYFGKHLRKRLLRSGIDLSTAPELHKQLACEGSVCGNWATLDLSSASDTIALNVVRTLLSPEWFRVLDACRTPCVDIGSDFFEYEEIMNRHGIYDPIHVLEKFSSMGNGFTFELETIIFLAICRAVCSSEHVGGVFGDDMIVGTDYCVELCTVLQAFGFSINFEKSFATGNFRESCGGDYAGGIDVKGVTLKSEPNCVTEWYDLHNRIWRLNETIPGIFDRTLNTIRKMVPSDKRLSIPSWLGSGGFFSHDSKPRIHNSIAFYKCYVPVTKHLRNWECVFTPDVQLAAGLLGGIPSNNRGWLQGPPLYSNIPSCKLAWVPAS